MGQYWFRSRNSNATDSSMVKSSRSSLNGADNHEMEVLESCDVDEETELHQRRDVCQKNPGHEGFIPVTHFNLQHLPESHRDMLCQDFIKVVIDLTVRLRVKYASPSRPDGYPLSHNRGRSVKAFGSGRLTWVLREFKEIDLNGEGCPCPHCETLPDKKRKKQWGMFKIKTAKHVVFNTEESRYTQVDVDYNTNGDEDECPKLHGVGVGISDIEEDLSLMRVVSHDRDVCVKLEEKIKRYTDLRSKLRDKKYQDSNDQLMICVSHPHGMSKHFSVGGYKGEQKDSPYKWRYTTMTCPGSSGAPICSLVDPGRISHHSMRDRDSGYNASGMAGFRY